MSKRLRICTARRLSREEGIDAVLKAHKLDALVALGRFDEAASALGEARVVAPEHARRLQRPERRLRLVVVELGELDQHLEGEVAADQHGGLGQRQQAALERRHRHADVGGGRTGLRLEQSGG